MCLLPFFIAYWIIIQQNRNERNVKDECRKENNAHGNSVEPLNFKCYNSTTWLTCLNSLMSQRLESLKKYYKCSQ